MAFPHDRADAYPVCPIGNALSEDNRLTMPAVFETLVSDLCREIIEAKDDATEFEARVEECPMYSRSAW
jgi:hypothetical protein